jgi:enoyl-CoA hydratase
VNNLVNYVAEGGVATLTLNDPPVNAYTHEMMKEFDEAVLEARFDNDVQAIVITGHGERFFSAGANLHMLREVDPTFKYYFYLHANETLLRLEQTPKLVIAAINGHCLGGGLEIALACDIRIGRKGAGKLGFPELSLGMLPGTGGTQRLTRLVGKARAMQLLLDAETFDFERALELGLVHRVIDAPTSGDFLRATTEYARGQGLPRRSPLAVGRLKRSVQSASETSLEQGLALERELQFELFSSDDAHEGFAAFSERRTPVFKGQ